MKKFPMEKTRPYITLQLIAISYLLFFLLVISTSPTTAYFSSESETIKGTILASVISESDLEEEYNEDTLEEVDVENKVDVVDQEANDEVEQRIEDELVEIEEDQEDREENKDDTKDNKSEEFVEQDEDTQIEK